MNLIGEFAALATSFFFAFTALIFTSAGRMVGSQVTNRTRLIFALLYLVILNFILFRQPLPFSAGSPRWIWLSFSGVIGLSLGDTLFFLSLIAVGPRLGSLLLSLAPIFGSFIAWIFFGETLTPSANYRNRPRPCRYRMGCALPRRTTRYAARTYTTRCDLWRAGRARSSRWTRLLKAGNVWRFFPIPGKCDPDAGSPELHLAMDTLPGRSGRDIFHVARQTTIHPLDCTGRSAGTTTGCIIIPARCAACRDRCGKYADGTATGNRFANQLFLF